MIKHLELAIECLRRMFADAGVEGARVIIEAPNSEAAYVLQSWVQLHITVQDFVAPGQFIKTDAFKLQGVPVEIRARPRETAHMSEAEVLAAHRALRAAIIAIQDSGLTTSLSDHESASALACVDIINAVRASLPAVRE